MATRVSYSFPPTADDWVRIQDVVRSLYVDQKLPLKEVRTVLRERHNFRATDRMIKARLKQWGYLKNAKREDWHFLVLLHESRQASGRSITVFDVRGHRKTVKDLFRFIRNQDMSTEAFLEEARTKLGDRKVPDYIRALTPGSDELDEGSDPRLATISPKQPRRSSTQHAIEQGSMFKLQSDPLRTTQTNVEAPLYDTRLHPSHYLSMNPTVDIRSLDQNPTSDHSIGHTNHQRQSDFDCNQMQTEFEMIASQIIRPAPLSTRFGDDNISAWALVTSSPSGSEGSARSVSFVCSRCNKPSDQHFVSLNNYHPNPCPNRDILNGDDHTLHLPVSTRDEGSWLWVSRCFLACMCLKKGEIGAAEQSLEQATNEFERLLVKKDSQLLTAAGLVMTILAMHDQFNIAKRVISSAYAATERALPPDHPTRVTFGFLTATAKTRQREEGYDSLKLRQVYLDYLNYYAPNHEYVIVARYNYAWMLKFEGRWEEAEAEAREVYGLSCSVFGDIHMQSVTALAAIAGCLAGSSGLGQACIAPYKKVVKCASRSLGRHHPYTLEARRRLAAALVARDGIDQRTLRLYRDLLFGRAHMLGINHDHTIDAKADYEDQLRALDMWVDAEGRPTQWQRDVIDLFSPDSPGSWTMISRRRTMSSGDRSEGLASASEKVNFHSDSEDDVIMVDSHAREPHSPRSAHEFEAY